MSNPCVPPGFDIDGVVPCLLVQESGDRLGPESRTPPQLAAKAYLLMDYHTGQVLFGENAHERLPPASLTKMMTSYIIGQELKTGNIKASDMVTISQNAWSKNYSDSSKMFIEVGKQVSVDNLNKGIIIQDRKSVV